jgi:hypothetical protein
MKKCLLSLLTVLAMAMVCLSVPEETREDWPRLEQPLLITSVGQSADVQIAGVLAKKAGLAATLSKAASEEELGNIRTLVLVIGVSMKGLGAAGLDLDQETSRVNRLIDAAQNQNISLLCLHLGGEARRGTLSDQLLTTFLPFARMVIVVKSGNKDGLFTRICGEENIPLLELERTLDAVDPLKTLFQPDTESFLNSVLRDS